MSFCNKMYNSKYLFLLGCLLFVTKCTLAAPQQPPEQQQIEQSPLPNQAPINNELIDAQQQKTSLAVSYRTMGLTALIAVATAAGFLALTVIFFPMFTYNVCYALGGCQNVADDLVDKFLGVEGSTRQINKRLLEAAQPFLNNFNRAQQKYGGQFAHAIKKRSILEHLPKALSTLSEAYEEYMDEGTKKNFKKSAFIR